MRALGVIALIALIASASPAHAELGAVLGVRETSLDGQTPNGDGRLNFAGAMTITRSLGHGFEAGAEPGLRYSGSTEYRFAYLAVPVVARYLLSITSRVHLRVVAGWVPGVLINAETREQKESSGYEWVGSGGIATLHLEALLGVGVDHVTASGRRYFAELRASRGLVTVDGGDMPVAVFSEELGLWVGFSR